MALEEDAARPRKKQRVGGAPSAAAATATTSRAKFAFGSRLPDSGKSLLKGPKSSGKSRLYGFTRIRHEQEARALSNPRKRRRSLSRDSDEATTKTKPSHQPLTVKTTLPLQGSHLPAPTKVSDLLSSAHLHTISPSNPAARHKKRLSADKDLVADLVAMGPEFWIKRREAVDAAMKELDVIEKRIMAITE